MPLLLQKYYRYREAFPVCSALPQAHLYLKPCQSPNQAVVDQACGKNTGTHRAHIPPHFGDTFVHTTSACKGILLGWWGRELI